MQDTSYSLAPLFAEFRAELRGMRAARAARKELARELAGAQTPGDFLELDAILERYDEDQTAEIRSILNERRPAWQPQPATDLPGRVALGS
jgi:hypothetical protein